MFEYETKRYAALNDLAGRGGVVIFGGTDDQRIPLCELRQAFSIDAPLYNRSIGGLSIADAAAAYDECVAPLDPETVLLHIGEADLQLFADAPADFDKSYRQLIAHIRARSKQCRIAVISLKNREDSAAVAEMNRHLKYIAESEQCEFGDIAGRRVWNPQGTKDVLSFIYGLGFVRPLKNQHPLYDLIKILFCCEAC